MGKKEWTQLWLEYKNVSSDNKTVSCSVEGFDKDSQVIKSALCELKCGLKGILSDEVVDNTSSCDIVLDIVKEDSIAAEGYKIAGREEKTIVFGLTGTGYFDLTAYESFNNGTMSDYIPTDEDLAKGFASIPELNI